MIKHLHFMIGDIHGCYAELVALEKKIASLANSKKLSYTIVSVGDLIDRGPESKKVVQHFLDGQHHGTHLAVMGNHEALMIEYFSMHHLDWCRKNKVVFPRFFYTPDQRYKNSRWSKGLTRAEYPTLAKAFWFAQGGVETLNSYGIRSKTPKSNQFSMQHLKYICQLPIFLETKDFIVTHALPIKKDLHFARQYFKKNTPMNDSVKQACNRLYWNREIKTVSPIGKKILISGHTPSQSVQRNRALNIIQIDTHCFAGGKLTAYCPELNKCLSVKAKKRYY